MLFPVQIWFNYPMNDAIITAAPAPETEHEPADTAHFEAAYRSGAAARLAGVPVETLRVWERRHQVTTPQRSSHGQRLYSQAEIRRLSMIKQLVDLGNQIGAIASLPDAQLITMLGIARAAPASTSPARPLRLALVGQALALRMQHDDPQRLAIDIVASCPHLPHAAAALRGKVVDVLVLELSEMTPATLQLISGIKQAVGAAGVVILYRFGSSDTIRQLRECGHVVAHAPSDAVEIALLCRSALPGPARFCIAPDAPGAALPARRFDDQALAQLALASSNIRCECSRQLAEILLTMSSFERYSAECASSNEADAALHHDLQHSAARARALLEQTMERLAHFEGLPLPAAPSAKAGNA
ncbi:MAG: DNA-binding transcriptional MerR regulator [Janthinobacterium sp.]|jgi:DNA-binding transcriptional MerR regulator